MSDNGHVTDKRQRDFDDLQHELAGVDVGRMRRFLNADDDRSPEGKRKKQERARQTLEDLMRDPEYARLYVALGDRLRDAEVRADTALAAIQNQLASVSNEIVWMEDAAARGPDGRQVFRFTDGRAVYADGSDVGPEIAEGIIWPPSAPTADDYFAAETRRNDLQNKLTEWDIYRNDVLGGLRHRYDSDDTPMSKDDLKDALDSIENLRPTAATLDTSTTTDAVLSAKPPAFPVFS